MRIFRSRVLFLVVLALFFGAAPAAGGGGFFENNCFYKFPANPPGPIIETDTFNHSAAMIELQHPSGSVEVIYLKGPSTIQVDFEGAQEGDADDDDGDQLDEVAAEITVLNLWGYCSGGYVHMNLNANLPSRGEMEETNNVNTGRLDVPPFGPTGSTASSFFDVYFTLDIGGTMYYCEKPMRWSGLITNKPPGTSDLYENSQPVTLIDANGNPTGFSLRATWYLPNPPVEVDLFSLSLGWFEITDPLGVTELVKCMGPSEMHVFFEGPQEGDAFDNDGNDQDEVDTEMVSLNLTGSNPSLGPVTLRLNPGKSLLGLIEEISNPTRGVLDLPPFGPAGSAANSFFDVLFELEMNGQLYYVVEPVRLISVISNKPPGPGEVYESPQVFDLLHPNGQPSGYRLSFVRYEPNPLKLDFGDACDPAYPTLLPQGAHHVYRPLVFLGAGVDIESDGQSDPMALGDDNDGNDDEDGVKFLTWPLEPGRWATVEVTASAAGLLHGWVDFNGDGSWAQAGDQIFHLVQLMPGVNTLTFPVPITAAPNINTFARFRFTTVFNPDLGFEGPADDGEVEDYLVKIKDRCGVKWVQLPDQTENGIDIRIDSSDEIIRTMADDFLCTGFNRITKVILWGSWKFDVKGEFRRIHLSIHSDDPAGAEGTDRENTSSKPDVLLWERDFYPGEFKEKMYAQREIYEYWWDPVREFLEPRGDRQIWQVEIPIDSAEAFLQDGTPENPLVYWLDVQVDTVGGEFGWKMRRWPHHYNDDAVLAVGPDLPPVWQDLHYPAGHPYYGINFDDLVTGAAYIVGNSFTTSGFSIDVRPFQWTSGEWTSGGRAIVGDDGFAGGSGNEIMPNNVNLELNITEPLSNLSLLFGETGGNINLEINGDFRNFENFSEINGLMIGGVKVIVVNGLGNDRGSLHFNGAIEQFAIGGQELWLDNWQLYSVDMAFMLLADDFCPSSADLNCDGVVNMLDWAIFASQWLNGCCL